MPAAWLSNQRVKTPTTKGDMNAVAVPESA